MTTIIHPTRQTRSSRTVRTPVAEQWRKPLYDCQDQDGSLRLVVYVPGVDGSGINIEARGPDLVVTARKKQFVRVNCQALHLEPFQRDYRLNLRLGRGYAYEAMDAEIHQGVLTITLPKRSALAAADSRLRVA
jgi:HSP20 family molecular chaperone IbpA